MPSEGSQPISQPARSTLERWFLTPGERGNAGTTIDQRSSGAAFTEHNEVTVLVHGADYYRRLHTELMATTSGDWVWFTDWRGDPDERLAGAGTEVAHVLASLAGRAVQVRGLVWRSHADEARLSEQENLHLVTTVNEAGGEVLLDERVRRVGSHHQKLFIIGHPARPDRDIAFVGGIDLCHGRGDDERHAGDAQAIGLDRRYGPRPAWHDVQLQVRGPAVDQLAWSFRERWEDPTPLDHRNPWRAWIASRARQAPQRPHPLPALGVQTPAGQHSVQVLRTYPAKRPAHPFAPDGERSIARAYLKAFGQARRLVYVEDQYLWSGAAADALARRLREEPRLHVVAVVPRYPDQDSRFSGPPFRVSQHDAIAALKGAGGDRVRVFDLESPSGWPIYVHAKLCVVDDVWMIVGSDNLNMRSWTNDSEISCAVIDEQRDERRPIDPGGGGDGARRLARETRLRLWREHLGRAAGDDADLVDGVAAFDTLDRAAETLDAWIRSGRVGPRPPGRLRPHEAEPVPRWARWWARPVHRLLLDPDGRPRRLRRTHRF